jgi:hypothetical protein
MEVKENEETGNHAIGFGAFGNGFIRVRGSATVPDVRCTYGTHSRNAAKHEREWRRWRDVIQRVREERESLHVGHISRTDKV